MEGALVGQDLKMVAYLAFALYRQAKNNANEALPESQVCPTAAEVQMDNFESTVSRAIKLGITHLLMALGTADAEACPTISQLHLGQAYQQQHRERT